MMLLLSQTNFPDKHETAPVASPGQTHPSENDRKQGNQGCGMLKVCVRGSWTFILLSVCEIFGGGCVAMVGAFPLTFPYCQSRLFSRSLS